MVFGKFFVVVAAVLVLLLLVDLLGKNRRVLVADTPSQIKHFTTEERRYHLNRLLNTEPDLNK